MFSGMFMVCVNLRDQDGDLVANSCRSAMLHYRSSMLETLIMVLFSPFFVFGSAEEKQTLTLELFSDFLEDPVSEYKVYIVYMIIMNTCNLLMRIKSFPLIIWNVYCHSGHTIGCLISLFDWCTFLGCTVRYFWCLSQRSVVTSLNVYFFEDEDGSGVGRILSPFRIFPNKIEYTRGKR